MQRRRLEQLGARGEVQVQRLARDAGLPCDVAHAHAQAMTRGVRRIVLFCGRGKAQVQRCERIVPRALGRAPTDFTGFALRVGASGAWRVAA
ncbi:hypothetical protein O4H66_20755 [Comamonadaceae bacterium G21597-S1]|nr:hypothetical protein [Comamonadaceae bacterium G21597-S1]